MFAPSGSIINLWLHIMAACVWIGGQIVIGMLVPVLRGEPTLLRVAARRYQVLAWIAFAVLILTGIENMHNAGISFSDLQTTKAGHTLGVKLAFVLLSGLAAAVHAFIIAPRAATVPGARAWSGILGGISLLAAMAAALYGVVLVERA